MRMHAMSNDYAVCGGAAGHPAESPIGRGGEGPAILSSGYHACAGTPHGRCRRFRLSGVAARPLHPQAHAAPCSSSSSSSSSSRWQQAVATVVANSRPVLPVGVGCRVSSRTLRHALRAAATATGRGRGSVTGGWGIALSCSKMTKIPKRKKGFSHFTTQGPEAPLGPDVQNGDSTTPEIS